MVKITQQQKLELLGLLTLARQHYRVVDQCRDAVTEIVGVDDSVLHDSLWDYNIQFDKALKDSDIEVEDATS